MTRRSRIAAATVLVLVPALVHAGLADLAVSISQIMVQRDTDVSPEDVAEGCAGGPSHRTLVRFTLETLNQGTADVVLGDPGCPACVGDPLPVCTNPLFMCSEAMGHHHPHFSKYAFYSLLPRPDSDPVATGRKQGFCIEDTLCDVRRYNCNYQGLQVGCRDAYFYVLGCQYVDATGVPGGRYLLRAEVNYAHIIPESDYTNDVAETPVDLCDPVTSPRIHFARLAGRRSRWSASGAVHFASPPLVPRDPLADGAVVRLGLDGATLLDVVLPGGGHGTGCAPRDGWRATDTGWRWQNTSGFLDAACTVPAQGLESFTIVRRTDGFDFLARGRLAHTAAELPARAEATVVLGAVTGPCGTAQVEGCRARLRPVHDVTCPGSPSGAFLAPVL